MSHHDPYVKWLAKLFLSMYCGSTQFISDSPWQNLAVTNIICKGCNPVIPLTFKKITLLLCGSYMNGKELIVFAYFF